MSVVVQEPAPESASRLAAASVRNRVETLRMKRRLLPDLAPGLADHRVSRLAAEGLLELGQRRGRSDRPELRQRVGIRVQQELRALGPDVGGPDAGPSEEEPLIVGEAVDLGGGRLPLPRHLIRAIRDREAAEVRRRLAEDELAVGVLALVDVRVVLILDA